MKTLGWLAICVMLSVSLMGCPSTSNKKTENTKELVKLYKTALAKGTMNIKSQSDDPAARSKFKADGIEWEGPANMEANVKYNTDESVTEKNESWNVIDYFKSTSLWGKFLAIALIAVGIFVAVKVYAPAGVILSSIGVMYLMFETYSWTILVIAGALVLGAAYYIWNKYATDAQKAKAEETYNATLSEVERKAKEYKAALKAIIKSVDESPSKKSVTSLVSGNAEDPEAVKDTITDIKRSS